MTDHAAVLASSLRASATHQLVNFVSDADSMSDIIDPSPHVSEADHGDQLRRRLKYFFMNPCEKYRAKRKVPWKLILQLVKVVLVTIQVYILLCYVGSRVLHQRFAICFTAIYLYVVCPVLFACFHGKCLVD